MTSGFKPVFTRESEILNALERVFIGCDSPGVKMSAGFAIELLTGTGQSGRPFPAKSKNKIQFVVSATILSATMDEVLIRAGKRGDFLPRIQTNNLRDRATSIALSLAAEVSGDKTIEMGLLGRPLSVELWDDDSENLRIGLNFLLISRTASIMPQNHSWKFTAFKNLDLNLIDPREALALSEMLTIMGISNPYEMEDRENDDINSAA